MDGVGVQVAIVLTWAERAILLSNEEEGCGLRGFGWDDPSSLQMFVNESFACFLFFWIEGVYLSDFWNEQWFEVNGVIIWLMRGENIMGLLREYVFEVGTPVRDLLIGGFGGLGQLGGQGNLAEMFAVKILLREILTERRIILRRISLEEERKEFHVRVTSEPSK